MDDEVITEKLKLLKISSLKAEQLQLLLAVEGSKFPLGNGIIQRRSVFSEHTLISNTISCRKNK